MQFHVPRFHKDREARLERSLLVRVSQNVMTCPTTAAFNVLARPSEKWFPLGRKLAYFGDGHQFKAERFGRRCWVVPILSRRVRHRAADRLGGRADGREPVVLRRDRRRRARSRDESRRGSGADRA